MIASASAILPANVVLSTVQCECREHRQSVIQRGPEMAEIVDSPASRTGLTRILCVVVFIVMFAALLYAGWIGVSNFSRIHV
jgi:hypothetical protein